MSVEQATQQSQAVPQAPQSQVAPAGASAPQQAATAALATDALAAARVEAERDVLKQLGFADVKDAKAKLASLKALEQASMTEQQKTAALIEELKPKAERAAVLEAQMRDLVDVQFKALPAQVQAAVQKHAGDNPEKRLEMIRILADAGALTGTAVPAVPQIPPPVNDAPPGGNPRPTAPQTAFDKFEAIRKEHGQVAADLFYSAHRLQIEASRPKAA